MAEYIIKKKYKKLKINKINRVEGYELNHKIKNKKMISIESLIIENQSCTNNLIQKKLNKNFRDLMTLYLQAMNSDDDGDVEIALSEIERIKKIITYKYQEKMSKELILKYLKRLSLFEKNLKEKENLLRLNEELMWNKGKAR